MTKTNLLLTVACLALTAGAAQAATWEITDRAGAEHGLHIKNNDTLGDIGVIKGDGKLQAGRLNVLEDNKVVQFFYLGSESGYNVKLTSGEGSHVETNRDPGRTVAEALTFKADVTNRDVDAGLLDLAFSVDGRELVDNFNNPMKHNSPGILYGYLDLVKPDLTEAHSKHARIGNYQLVSYATDLVLFALDDGGASKDRDFDDYIGVAHITPIPAAAFLLAPAVGGLAWARRRGAA